MNSIGYAVKYPVRHGIVEVRADQCFCYQCRHVNCRLTVCAYPSLASIQDWDLMEHYWEHCIFKYLRVEVGYAHRTL